MLNDELYLEEHRGVYTTKGRLKKLNRYCEFLYRKAELFSCFADVPYPQDNLDRGWKIVLTNQFHDSLPGTHVTAAYQDLLESYDKATGIGEHILRDALADIAGRVDTRGPGRAIVVFNSHAFARDSIARVKMQEREVHVLDSQGRQVPCQFIAEFVTGDAQLVCTKRQ